MKNIHILPTNKPSRLFIWMGALLKISIEATNQGTNQNIYITNSEEIKDGDIDSKVCIFKSSNGIITCLAGKGYGRVKTFGKYYEVILTTDQDLIKDGVQDVDDEFLEWFVKNPSCEEVEIFHQDVYSMGKWDRRYKIIIPQEEPKPHLFCETPEEKCTMNYCDENGCQNRKRELVEPQEEPKQDEIDFIANELERSYSEEEKDLLNKMFNLYWYENNNEHEDNLEKWELSKSIFEKFKKK